ncbi:hypothetical protein [Streptomyces cellulosae]|uniref:hypothetical protein n=1 Tax=Streptomyces cellulosae TaxID=1968 RepID=UPI0004CBED51|nr:hypothetical protein [Streptomyces cellulosae]
MNTHDQYIRLAFNAVSRAASLAEDAEDAAHSDDRRNQAAPLAAAGALWADVARSYTAIAEALPESNLGDPTED